jgi:hypothetical protein
MKQPIMRWHSATWWAGVTAVVAIIGVIVAILAWLHPFSSDANVKDEGLARTPNLGLEIYQDSKRVPLHPQSNHVKASLASRRFEIRFATLQENQGIHICAWTDDSVFQMSNLFDPGQCFGYGSGVADSNAGSEDLFVGQHGHNYLVNSRIAPAGDGFQTIYIANIVDGLGAPPRQEPWGQLYLAVLEDPGPNDDPLNTPTPHVDPGQLDFLELNFN